MVEIADILEVKDMDIDKLEFNGEIISFDEYIRGLTPELQPQLNSLSKAVGKRFGLKFMEVRCLPYEKGLTLLARYHEEKNLMEEKAFLAKRSKSS